MNTAKYAAILKLACVAALVSSSPAHGATQLETLPVEAPSCEVVATVDIKLSNQPTTFTYTVRSYYWNHGALAFRIERGKFAMAAYENIPRKTSRYWIRNWDPVLGSALASADNNLMLTPIAWLASMGPFERLEFRLPDSETLTYEYSPWEKVSDQNGLSVYARRVRTYHTDSIRKRNPLLPAYYDTWTTVTLASGNQIQSMITENPFWGVGSLTVFRDYTPEGIPRIVHYVALGQRRPPNVPIDEYVARAQDVRLLSSHDTEERITRELAKNLRPVRRLPYTPIEIERENLRRKHGILGSLLSYLGSILAPAILPLSLGILVLAIVRKLRLI